MFNLKHFKIQNQFPESQSGLDAPHQKADALVLPFSAETFTNALRLTDNTPAASNVRNEWTR
jgi:hypothetical protein